jgi:tetratricopeptide (TPR) repeat protein
VKLVAIRALFIALMALVPLLWGSAANAQAIDARVKDAMKLIDLGNAKEAEFNLRQLVTAEPKNAEVHAGLAIADLDLGGIDGATQEAQAAFDIDRRNVLARVARGMVYGKQGKVEDALSEFHQALKLNDKEIGSYLAMSRYYISIDSLKVAEITLYRAQALNAQDVRSFFGLAELYERQHIPDLAISEYEQAVKIDPKEVTVHAKLAGLYFRTRRYNESAGEWLKIIRIDSTYPDAYYQIANLYFLAKQYPNAAKYATRYAQLRPNDINGQWLLARSLTETGQYKEALPALQAVSSNDSLRALSQLLLARSYFYSKDYPKALDIYKVSPKLGPSDMSSFGTILVMNGDTASGIEQYKKSLVDDTVRTAQQKLETQVAIVNLLYKLKRFEEAGDVFSAMGKANPSVDWYVSAGQAYAAAKKPDLAKQAYEKALAIDPNSLKVRMQMAMDEFYAGPASETALAAFDKLKSVAQARASADTVAIAEGFTGYHYAALKDWQKTVEHLAPSVKTLESTKSAFLPSFTLVLAESYHQLHEFDKAKEYYEKELKLDPDNEGAKKGLEYLKQPVPSEEKSPKKSKK